MSELLHCPVCDERANERIHPEQSKDFAGGPPITICNGYDGVYVHVKD